jgi:hypothetical protein
VEQLIDQAAMRCFAGYHSFEDMRIANLFDSSHGALLFETVDYCLDRGVGGPFPLRQMLLNLSDGRLLKSPYRPHDFHLKLR